MKVVVLGALGQLARSLQERSQACPGIELVLIGRPEFDLESENSPDSLIADLAPDVVVNAAAYTAVDLAEDEPDRAFKVNALGAERAAAAAYKAGAPIIQVSTDYVFNGSATDAYDETAKVDPLGIYGRSKLAGEQQVRAANPRYAIVRTAWVFSPFGRNFVKSIIAAARSGKTLRVVNDQHGSPTYALDLADGLLAMLLAGGGWGETYHLAGRPSASWFDVASEVMVQCERSGLPNVPVDPIVTADWPTRAARPSNSVLDSSKFEQAFGFTMPAWRDSVAALVKRLAISEAD